MDSVKTRLEEMDRQLEGEWEALRDDALRLAQLALNQQEGPLSLLSPSLRSSFVSARARQEDLERRLEQRTARLERLNQGQERLSLLTRQKAEEGRKLGELETLIGAVALEQASGPAADSALKEALAPLVAQRETLYGAEGFLGRIRRSLYQMREEGRFRSVFHVLEEKGLLDLLTGERAQSLVAEWKALHATVGDREEEIRMASHSLSAQQLTSPDDSRLEQDLAAAEADSRESGIAYGMQLFDSGHKWLGPEVGDDILDVVQSMLSHRQAMDDLHRQAEKEKDWAAIEDFRSMIGFNRSKIDSLRAEIGRLEGEIAALEEANRGLEKKIANVKERMR